MKSARYLKIMQIAMLIFTALVPGFYLLVFINDITEGLIFNNALVEAAYEIGWTGNAIERIFNFFVFIMYLGIWVLPIAYFVTLISTIIDYNKNKKLESKPLTAVSLTVPVISYIIMLLAEFGGLELLS